jgi:hypothetical protein
VSVRIGEIVLHGVPVRDPYALGDAVRERLAELVAERGLPPGAADHPAPAAVDPDALAAGIAEAVWQRLEVPR